MIQAGRNNSLIAEIFPIAGSSVWMLRKYDLFKILRISSVSRLLFSLSILKHKELINLFKIDYKWIQKEFVQITQY